MIDEGERTDFGRDLPSRRLDFFDQLTMVIGGFVRPQPGNTELQIKQELACGIMKLMADTLAFIVTKPKQLFEQLLTRAMNDMRGRIPVYRRYAG